MMMGIRRNDGDAAANNNAFIIGGERDEPRENGRQRRTKRAKKEALLQWRDKCIARNSRLIGTVAGAAVAG